VVLETAIDRLFPLRCPGCGARAAAGAPACAPCLEGLAAPEAAPAPVGLDAWWAALRYEGVARELVARVKYRHARAAVPWLADAMAAAVPVRARTPLDAVTWPPTTRAHRRDRGFDHAELLARAVASRLRYPAVPLLVRTGGDPQTGRPSGERRSGGPAFAARGPVPPAVLLVDDVATTGATLRAAAAALRRAGATSVVALTAARTPRPR
jgi:predicted amidophosphoribosyltransferase